ncbi:MAG: hypothetical protein AN487_22575 [Anabaena sp. CRKS33]|nr:MAG: hypothetical protein AN487_22575 [Anabaena sp. CRKS33]
MNETQQPAVAGPVEPTVRRGFWSSFWDGLGMGPVWRWLACKVVGHQYQVLRRMNPGARKVGCDRCGAVWGMHDRTQTLVPWDDEFEAMYALGGPLDPEHYKG